MASWGDNMVYGQNNAGYKTAKEYAIYSSVEFYFK
jgi:hypothetical protein